MSIRISEKRLAANRANARKSTGPRSPEGKAAARFNALKSGIDAKSNVIPGESAATLEALAAAYHDRFRPGSPEQVFLVDLLVSADWLLRRLRRVEAQLWQNAVEDDRRYDDLNPNWPLGRVFSRKNNDLTRLQRRTDSTTRTYLRALDRLERLRSSPDPGPAATSVENGFVPPESKTPASGDPSPATPVREAAAARPSGDSRREPLIAPASTAAATPRAEDLAPAPQPPAPQASHAESHLRCVAEARDNGIAA
jgi:hypothetical protein